MNSRSFMLSTHHLGVYLNDFLLKYESTEYDEFAGRKIKRKLRILTK